MTDSLKHVHDAELYILCRIDEICRRHGIKYMLDAGTLLGAVRHGGFIPWDDDADIAMTRENFDRFLAVCRELPEGLVLLGPGDLGSRFFDFTSRVVFLNSRTHASDNPDMVFYEGKLNHLWVDIFVLDELPENPLAACLVIFLQKVLYGMAMGHRRSLDFSKYSTFHRAAVAGLSAFGKLFPMQAILKMQEALSRRFDKGRSNTFYYSTYQPDFLYMRQKRVWTEDIRDMSFEGKPLMVSGHFHEVLRDTYGDYMTPPPADKQVPSHSDIPIEVWDLPDSTP